MKKNILFKYASLLVFVFTFASCGNELMNINKNPNNLEVGDAPTLLSNAIASVFYNTTFYAWTLGNGMSQYVTYSQSYYNGPSRYQPVSNEPYWIATYSAARDAGIVQKKAQDLKSPALQAVASTLQAFAFSQLTDLWGDIPFKSALQGTTGNFIPVYDKQQTVYTDPAVGILATLRAANDLLKSNPTAPIPGDILYSGNTIKWRKFINGLRLRLLLRVSGKMDVSSEMQAIVSEGVLFQNASENAALSLPTSGTNYQFPGLLERSGDFQIKYMNSLLYNSFVSTGDQYRMPLFFTKNSINATQSGFDFNFYGGMPVVSDATTSQVQGASLFNPFFNNGSLQPSSPAIFNSRVITYAEVQFILAEASLNGLISGDAGMFYKNGITGAFSELGLSSGTANSYIQNAAVVFNTSDKTKALTQIVTQKWIANLNVGFEGWLEFRRTGIPQLSATSANRNNNKISNRFLYPNSEVTINSQNYTNEINAAMGGKENIDFRPWW